MQDSKNYRVGADLDHEQDRPSPTIAPGWDLISRRVAGPTGQS